MIIPWRLRLRMAAGSTVGLLCAAIAQAKDPAVLALTADHFKQTATVTDDPTAGSTTLSTEHGFVQYSGPMRMVWNDEFLKGVIDRKSGRRSFSVSVLVIYSGSFRSYGTARWPAEGGLHSVNTTSIDKKVENCAVGECTYTERVEFPVESEWLRRLAAGDAPGKPTLWRYELIANSGPAYAGALSSAEIAGFLARVDEAAAAPRRELGIEGITVAASADQPTRAGVLVAAVKSGSIAHKAGLITGDIVYECDGHPVSTVAQLQSAVSAGAAGSNVAMRLYRGLATMTVTVDAEASAVH